MNDELKPCPFCGGKAEIIANQDGNIQQVVCASCRASNLWSIHARELWNKRTRKDTSLLPCPICGYKGKLWQAYDGSFCLQCSHCGLTSDFFRVPDEAKSAWNRRHDDNV